MAAILVKLEENLLNSDYSSTKGLDKHLYEDQNSPFEFYGPSIKSCFVPLLEPNTNDLVTFYSQQIVISSISRDTNPKLERIASFHTSNKILACNTIKPAGLETHWLLILTEVNEFFVLALKYIDESALDLIIIKTYKLTNHLMRKKKEIDYENNFKIVNSQKCFIKTDETGRFILIHCSKGFVIVLELRPSKHELFYLASINRPPKEIKRNPNLVNINEFKIFEKPNCYPLETDMVIDMEITNNGLDWWVAVFERSNNLSYSIGYYKMVVREELEYYQSFPSLKDNPNMIIPMNKFFILIYDSYHTICYYPDFGVDFKLNEDLVTNGTIEYNFYDRYAKQNLNIDNGMNKFFVNYTFIDDKNILLTTSTSEYYKIELEYEYIPHNRSRKRLRNYILPGNEIIENNLTFTRWEIKKLSNSNGLQPDQVFSVPLTNQFLSVNKHSEIAIFTFFFEKYTEPYFLSKSKLNLPITDLQVDKTYKLGYNDTPKVTYTSGDLQNTYLKTPKFNLKLNNETMKCFVQFEEFIVVLNESIAFDISTTSSQEIFERIDVYNNNGDCVAAYDFEKNIKVIKISPLSFPSPYPTSEDADKFYKENISEIENNIKLSFLVLTSSDNEEDYNDENDFVDRKRTEIMLFTIDEKSEELKLETISILNAKIDSVEVLNRKKFRLWGFETYFDFGLSLFQSKDKTAQLKFIKLNEGSQIIQSVSIIKHLEWKLNLLVDPYFGLYISKYDYDYKLLQTEKFFSCSMITAVDIFSRDFVIVGDILGNIFLLNIVYSDADVPTCEVLASFNTTYGSIGAISCYKSENYDPVEHNSLIAVCTIGTALGAIITLYISNSLENKIVAKELKSQNKNVMSQSLSFEQIAKGISINKLDPAKIGQINAYYELEVLLEERFPKFTLATDNHSHEKNTIPIVYKQYIDDFLTL